MVGKGVATILVIDAGTWIEAIGSECVGAMGPRHAKGMVRLGAIGEASENEKNNAPSTKRESAPGSLRFAVSVTVSVFGSVTADFVATVFP